MNKKRIKGFETIGFTVQKKHRELNHPKEYEYV